MNLDRYSRQIRFSAIGEAGQRRLAASRALVCGCGALGSVLANTLARSGVGSLRIVDRDFVETSNLQRQVLFDEDDVAAHLPKAVAAANKLRRINSEIEIEPIVSDVDHTNLPGLLENVDVIVDGTDNFETRFLLNDASVKFGLPWVYGGCIGAGGQTMTVLPGETPCLRCLIQEPPPPGATETCDTAGILSPIINVIASIQAMEAHEDPQRPSRSDPALAAGLRSVGEPRTADEGRRRCATQAIARPAAAANSPGCPASAGTHTAVLCGRNAVQLARPGGSPLSLEALADKLSAVGRVTRNPFLLRLAVDDYLLTVFPDGRAIIGGTDDIATARTLYARYIGN